VSLVIFGTPVWDALFLVIWSILSFMTSKQLMEVLYADRQGSRSLAGYTGKGFAYTLAGGPPPDQAAEAKEYTENAARTPRAREGELIGWRAWMFVWGCDVIINEPHLHSTNLPICWPGPSMTASEIPPPWPGHPTHGLYSMKKPDFFFGTGARFWGPVAIVGQVANWGIVREHELGYRAEHCIVRKLFVPSTTGLLIAAAATEMGSDWTKTQMMEPLSKRYQCEVEIE